jgi:hypothetical protein
MRMTFALIVSVLVVAGPGTFLRADDDEIEFFEKKVRPILVEHCLGCHATGAKKIGGSLLLDSRDALRKGGDSGAAIELGKPEESLLITAIRYQDESLKMPPKGKLPDAAIEVLEAWVKMGAPDPREKAALSKPAESWSETFRRRSGWWSLQPVRKHAVPAVKNASWSDHPVDKFILARLEERNLEPALPADPRTLARRLSLVLTGLPPDAGSGARFFEEMGCR